MPLDGSIAFHSWFIRIDKVKPRTHRWIYWWAVLNTALIMAPRSEKLHETSQYFFQLTKHPGFWKHLDRPAAFPTFLLAVWRYVNIARCIILSPSSLDSPLDHQPLGAANLVRKWPVTSERQARKALGFSDFAEAASSVCLE